MPSIPMKQSFESWISSLGNYCKSDDQIWCEYFRSYSRGIGHAKALWKRYASLCAEKGQKVWREEVWTLEFEEYGTATAEDTPKISEFAVAHISTIIREFVTEFGVTENPENSPYPPVEKWFRKIWEPEITGYFFAPQYSLDFLCRDMLCQKDDVSVILSVRIPVREACRPYSIEYFLYGGGIAKARHKFTNYEYVMKELREQGSYSHTLYEAWRKCVDSVVIDLLKQIKRNEIHLQ